MKDHSRRAAQKRSKKPVYELFDLWQTDIATCLSRHMKIDHESNPRTSGVFDPDSYLTWLKQYAQIKLEQGTVFKKYPR